MIYAINILEEELKKENTPALSEEEDDLIGAVSSQRKANHLKMGLLHVMPF